MYDNIFYAYLTIFRMQYLYKYKKHLNIFKYLQVTYIYIYIITNYFR